MDAEHKRENETESRTPQWVAQRRAPLVVGSIIGLAGVATALSTDGEEQKTAEAARAGSDVADKQVMNTTTEWDLPNLDHEQVDYWVERFTMDAEMREKMEGFLQRSGRYVPMLLEKLDERDMPRDLVYLAMIESGFEPEAYSHAHASGLWQFIAETGQRYGLEIDRAVDERNDPVKATDAALTYLNEMHERFDSWYLAAASYNTGENRVGRIMMEEFGTEKARSEADYYKIWSRLPKETRDYVPLMIAAGRIAKEPAKYGFSHIQPDAPLEYDEIVVPPATKLKDVAKAAGVTVQEIHDLNPHFKLNRTPNDRDYPVRIPAGSLQQLASTWGIELGPGVNRAVAG